jgi:glycosyltransferase involved in cell wall biosynthesis
MEPPLAKALLLVTKSNWGGAQTYVYDLATALAARGTEVVVALGGNGLLVEKLKEQHIKVISLPGLTRDVEMLEDRSLLVDPRAIYRSIRQEFSVMRSLITLIQEEKASVVHLNSSKMGGLGALAARLAGARTIVFTVHGWPHKEPRAFPIKTVIWLISWITVALCQKIIVVSENDVREAPVFFSRKKITLVRNGVAPSPLLSRSEAREKLTLPKDAKIILSIAELHRNKDIESAISAFAELGAQYPEWQYVVIGEGEERERLTEVIAHYSLQERVTLLGFRENARQYLLAADLFLLPSRKEGLPLTLLEAGLAGLPIIASRTGGIPEVVRHKDTGLLAPPHNPHALARALRTLLEHPEDAARYGHALKAYVEERFSKEGMLEGTFAVYRA